MSGLGSIRLDAPAPLRAGGPVPRIAVDAAEQLRQIAREDRLVERSPEWRVTQAIGYLDRVQGAATEVGSRGAGLTTELRHVRASNTRAAAALADWMLAGGEQPVAGSLAAGAGIDDALRGDDVADAVLGHVRARLGELHGLAGANQSGGRLVTMRAEADEARATSHLLGGWLFDRGIGRPGERAGGGSSVAAARTAAERAHALLAAHATSPEESFSQGMQALRELRLATSGLRDALSAGGVPAGSPVAVAAAEQLASARRSVAIVLGSDPSLGRLDAADRAAAAAVVNLGQLSAIERSAAPR